MNQHWQEPLPTMFERMAGEQQRRSITNDFMGIEVRLEPGAGTYEDTFKFYWLCVAWAMFAYHVLAMLILLVHMGWGGTIYLWIPHLVGTAIIIPAIACMALIYRYVLFPPPGYFSRTPRDSRPPRMPPSASEADVQRAAKQPEGATA